MIRTSQLPRQPHAGEPAGRKAGSVDLEIGQRIRRLRSGQRLSQEELAARIGISCQQLQKYESGANRISASRLVQLAGALSAEISLFLRDGPPADAAYPAADGLLSAGTAVNIRAGTPDGRAGTPGAGEIMALLTAFTAISNPESRDKITEMATFLAGLEAAPPKAPPA